MARKKTLTAAQLEAEKLRTGLFRKQDWLVTILAQPELADICPWQIFNEELTCGLGPSLTKPWLAILQTHPGMIKYAPEPFPAEYLDAYDWAQILILHPELRTKVPWEGLKWAGHKQIRLAWMNLLVLHPEFAKYCNWSIFYHHIGENNPNEWIKLLQTRPEFIKYYLKEAQRQGEKSGVTLILPEQWAYIIALRPELLEYAPKKQFTNQDWQTIITRQPQLCPKRMKNQQ